MAIHDKVFLGLPPGEKSDVVVAVVRLASAGASKRTLELLASQHHTHSSSVSIENKIISHRLDPSYYEFSHC
jgi:molybdenum cofactor biosynthesis enzyme